jgi:hypothetical protein
VTGADGKRRPPRPRIELLSAASETEAAAVVAAVEQFLIDTAPPSQSSARPANPWQRAALEEGISARQLGDAGWGVGGGWGLG